MNAPSCAPKSSPEAALRAIPDATILDAVGSQMAAASSLPARKFVVITSMFWFKYFAGLTPAFLKAS